MKEKVIKQEPKGSKGLKQQRTRENDSENISNTLVDVHTYMKDCFNC